MNVLNVMDCAAETLDREADGSTGLREARAAVAELIEAATEGVVGGCLCDTCERTRAALARCRGEA